MKIGIVGSGADKFTPKGEAEAKVWIRELLSQPGVEAAVSGHSPLGGIDIWTEELAAELGLKMIVYAPKLQRWSGGYRERNLQIAADSDIVYVIVPHTYPESYTGTRYMKCYHCNTRDHIKSGGCWTAKHAKIGLWHIVEN